MTQPRTSKAVCLLFLPLIVSLAGCASNVPQQGKEQVERSFLPKVVFVDEDKPSSVESRLVHHKAPALSVAVIRAGKLDWTAAWGNLQVGGPHADRETLFQAGSLSKPATLFAAMRIEQAGLIDFDKNIESYLTSYHLPAGKQTDENPVTFRNLFEHLYGQVGLRQAAETR